MRGRNANFGSCIAVASATGTDSEESPRTIRERQKWIQALPVLIQDSELSYCTSTIGFTSARPTRRSRAKHILTVTRTSRAAAICVVSHFTLLSYLRALLSLYAAQYYARYTAQ